MSVVRRGVAVAVAAFAALVLSGCVPYGNADRPNGVDLRVVVNADGTGGAQMFLDNTERSQAQIQAWGEAVGTRLFPSATSLAVRVDPNTGGSPFVVIDAPGLYQPGPQPQVSLDTRAAIGWLLASGTKTVDLTVESPNVPLTSSWTPPVGQGDHSWEWTGVTAGTAAPYGVIVMAPQPWSAAQALMLVVTALGLLVVSFVVFRRRRRRAMPMALSGMALGASVAVAALGTTLQPDNLGVAGTMSGTPVQVASFVTALALPIALAAGVLSSFYRTRRSSGPEPVFVAPPGWPPPPEGWVPPPGWQPDASWPAAPEGWSFYPDARSVGGR